MPGKPQPDAAARQRESQRAYVQRKTREGQDIGEIPPVSDPVRRQAASESFRVFCETYFREIFFYQPWSRDLLKVLAKIERAVRNGDSFAIAMPRGSGKSVLCRSAVLWGVMTSLHPYAMLISAVNVESLKSIGWFKDALSKNAMLRDDFPEICYPIWKLDHEPRKCMGQRYHDEKTEIGWGAGKITLPTIPGSTASGAVIEAASMEAEIRGRWIAVPGGRIIRPTLAMVDDPQTTESARSQGPAGQTTYRMRIINRDVKGLAGPDRPTGILVACTVIESGDLADQLLDRHKYPFFRGERTRRFYSWPANKGLWEEYRETRERCLRSDQPLDEAREFYRGRMSTCGRGLDSPPVNCPACARAAVCMDCGAQVDWAARIDDPRNLSAVQAAMHSFYEYGLAGFAAEFQNEPLTSEAGERVLTAEACAARFNGRPRWEIPLACTELTVGVDMQQSSLWYVVVAWGPDFTGYIVDYGVWPRQQRQVFTLADIVDSPNNFAVKYPSKGIEGQIQAGLEEFVTAMLVLDFPRAGGAGLMRVGRMFVDSGKWDKVVSAVKYRAGGATMLACKGMGIKAGNPPMAGRKSKPGEGKAGEHWYVPSVRGTKEFPFVAVDANYWKSEIHRGLLAPPGDPGAITIFGASSQPHALFASHITAETYTRTHGHGRDVEEWTLRPQRPDNHWLDAAYYAMAAASYQGISTGNGARPPQGVQRRRVPIAEMIARSNQGATHA